MTRGAPPQVVRQYQCGDLLCQNDQAPQGEPAEERQGQQVEGPHGGEARPPGQLGAGRAQGEAQLPDLAKQFVGDPHTCLFGTLSLWQGLDVPGETCQLVIIDRIPFPRPDDPLMSARAKAADQAGRNGFMEVSATHAALLLAQGAGRLIRTTTDRGVVAVLDPRLATARYGSFLKASLPPMWTTTDPALVRQALQRLAAPPR